MEMVEEREDLRVVAHTHAAVPENVGEAEGSLGIEAGSRRILEVAEADNLHEAGNRAVEAHDRRIEAASGGRMAMDCGCYGIDPRREGCENVSANASVDEEEAMRFYGDCESRTLRPFRVRRARKTWQRR